LIELQELVGAKIAIYIAEQADVETSGASDKRNAGAMLRV
jgi:hypothetical protein